MKKAIAIFFIALFFATCKKEEAIYAVKDAAVIPAAAVDTAFSFSVYPNPCDSETNVQLNIPRSSVLDIAVYDMLGRLAYRPNLGMNLAKGRSTVTFETGQLPSGIYFLTCSYEGQSQVKKIVVQH